MERHVRRRRVLGHRPLLQEHVSAVPVAESKAPAWQVLAVGCYGGAVPSCPQAPPECLSALLWATVLSSACLLPACHFLCSCLRATPACRLAPFLLCLSATGRFFPCSITNTLFGVAAAKLHAFGRPGAAGRGYDAWATDTWAWLQDVQMLNTSTSLLVDGLGPACEPTGAFWTYNQGMFVRLGVEVARLLPAANGTAALNTARAVVAGAAAYYAGDSNMTVVEKACGGGSCGHDGMAFKGVFMRDLGYSMEALAGGDGAALAWYRSYVANNTAALCSRDAQRVNAAQVAFGEHWTGPYATSAFPYISQTAGIDLLNAWSGAGPAGDDKALALILRELGMSAEEVLNAAAAAAAGQ